MFEVLSLLFEHFQDTEDFDSPEEIIEFLLNEGYGRREISQVMNCLAMLFYPHTVDAEYSAPTAAFRLFTPHEQSILPNDVRGLMHFLRAGRLDSKDCESVIRALMDLPGEEITVDNAKILTLIRLLGSDSEPPEEIGETLMNVLEVRGDTPLQ